MASSEIHAVSTVSGNQPRVRRIIEEATQTFKAGTPLELLTDGGLGEWTLTHVTNQLAGFSLEYGSSLTTLGVPKTLTFGSVPYESSAVNIPRGAPLNDGRVGLEIASPDTIFRGQVGPAQTAVITNIGVQYGMAKDSDGHWYVDLTNTTNKAVTIVKLDPQDQSATPRGVYFTVVPAAASITA